MIHGKLRKQGVNIKSLTEVKVIRLRYILYNLCSFNFMTELAYKVVNNIIFPDNQKALKMEFSERSLCACNSSQVGVKYMSLLSI